MSVNKDDFQKSLARLESMTKGQLFHTPSDSAPGTWAGSGPSDEDSMDDGINENGTDYDGVKKGLSAKLERTQHLTKAEIAIVKGVNPYPHIKSKLSKGKGLTAAERWVTKGAGTKVFAQFFKAEGMANVPTPDAAAEENKTARQVPGNAVANKEEGKEEPEKGAGTTAKSFNDAVAGQPDLSKAINMSPVMYQFAAAMGQALEGTEARIVERVVKSLAPIFAQLDGVAKSLQSKIAADGEFQKSLATAVVGIGEQVTGASDVAAQSQHLPAGGPRALRAIPGGQGQAQGGQPGVVQKSFVGPGGLDIGEGAMAKSQVVNVMSDMVKSGKLDPLAVVKFEATGEISGQVQQAVSAWAQGNRG